MSEQTANVTPEVKSACQECSTLKEHSQYAYRSWMGYRPMHSGYRPKSRWFKDDKSTHEGLERAYHLAEAKYRLHQEAHDKENANPHEVVRNLSIVIRGGRLKP
jgi:hypothetical protein